MKTKPVIAAIRASLAILDAQYRSMRAEITRLQDRGDRVPEVLWDAATGLAKAIDGAKEAAAALEREEVACSRAK